MKEKFSSVLVILFLINICVSEIEAQQLENGGLEAEGFDGFAVPMFWLDVESTDFGNATPAGDPLDSDIVSEDGPFANSGGYGIPGEGTTFVGSIFEKSSDGDYYQEGIKQVVNQFTPGLSYVIQFQQVPIKTSIQGDGSGSWQVYVDSVMVIESVPTQNGLDYLDINLGWEQKALSFVAFASEHTISFMPIDDDENSEVGLHAGVYMGIDDITLEECPYDQPPMQQEGNTWFVEGENLTNMWWYNCDTGISMEYGNDFSPVNSGNYYLTGSLNECVFEWPCEWFAVTDTKEIAPSRIDVYPNPAVDQLTVDLRRAGTSELKIRSAAGKILLETTLIDGPNVLDVSQFSPGLYLVEIIARRERTVQRIIKY